MNIDTELFKDGYYIGESFSSIDTINNIAEELKIAFESKNIIKVNNDGINIKTINGNELLSRSSSTRELYNRILVLLRETFGDVEELDDNKIGISANFLSKEENNFRLHFDRNQLTVVIYITNSNNFPLVVYPKMREDPRFYDGEGFPPVKSKKDVQPVKIYPKKGLGIVFWGRTTLHGVVFEPSRHSDAVQPRYSLQFAFDLHKSDYDGEAYYGNKSE